MTIPSPKSLKSKRKKKTLNRPKHRNLVRWDGDLDELLLLTVQSVCNNKAIKIPWHEVAEAMQNNVTEGAIVQHLAKLRVRRVEAGKQVPAPLRRGGGLGKGSTKRARTKDQKLADLSDSLDTSDEEYGVKARSKKTAKTHRSRKAQYEFEGEDSDDSSSDVVVGVGAQFLDYPNDPPDTPGEYSTEIETEMRQKSKIIVLRYQPFHSQFTAINSESGLHEQPQEPAQCYKEETTHIGAQEWQKVEAMNTEETLNYINQFAEESSRYVFTETTLGDSTSQVDLNATSALPNDFDQLFGHDINSPSYQAGSHDYPLGGTDMPDAYSVLPTRDFQPESADFSFAEPSLPASYDFGQCDFDYEMPHMDGSHVEDSFWYNHSIPQP